MRSLLISTGESLQERFLRRAIKYSESPFKGHGCWGCNDKEERALWSKTGHKSRVYESEPCTQRSECFTKYSVFLFRNRELETKTQVFLQTQSNADSDQHRSSKRGYF